MPCTATGAELCAGDGWPSWPRSFLPQQTTPDEVRAQVCEAPAESESAPVACARTGVALSAPGAVPNWPEPFAPQQRTPSGAMAQTCALPTAMAETPVRPGTTT